MMARTLWRAAVALLALLTLQLQIDRQSARQPELVGLVAEPLRAEAQLHLATQALDQHDTRTALAATRKLVERRPFPAEHLTMMARVNYDNGDIAPASRAVQLAALRGWRDPIAQATRLQLALDAGDRAEAGRRFTALMLDANNDSRMLAIMGQQVFAGSTGEAEAAVADLASNTDRWGVVLLRRGVEVIPAEAFAGIIDQSLARGAQFDCAQLASARDILARKDPQAGQTLQQAIDQECPA